MVVSLCRPVPYGMDLSTDPERTGVAAFERLSTLDRLVRGEQVVVVSDVATGHGSIGTIQVRTVD